MNFLKINCTLILFVYSILGYTQVIPADSSKQLAEVEVSTSRLTLFSNSNKVETFDSTLLSRYSTSNLADVLANESQIFIKSYGKLEVE